MSIQLKLITSLFALFSLINVAEANDNEIHMVYANKWPPFSSGHGGDVVGILPDIVRAIIEDRMGYKVIHEGVPWARAQKNIEFGQADAFITTPTDERLEYSIRSKSDVVQMPFQAFTRARGTAFDQLKQQHVNSDLSYFHFCDVLGNGWAESFYQTRGISFETVPTLNNCLKLISMGRADILVHARPVTEKFLKKLGLEDKIVTHPYVYSESPSFPLLLSKKSNVDDRFMMKFDETIRSLKLTGDYAILMKRILADNT